MALPANISTGRVEGQFIVGVADGTDANDEPDFIPAQGTIAFTASTPYLPNPTATPNPVTMLKTTIVGILDGEGYLCAPDEVDKTKPGRRGIRLVATDDTDASVTGWTWTATPRFKDVNGTRLDNIIPAFSFGLPSDSTIDLTTVVKVPSAQGVGKEQIVALAAAANTAAQTAEEAALLAAYEASQAKLVAKNVQDRALAGEFNGARGPEGPAGPNTVPTQEAVAEYVATPGNPAYEAVKGTVAGAVASDGTVKAAAAAAVSDAVAGMDLVEGFDSTGTEAEGGFTDSLGAATWLTHDKAGGPTPYAKDRLGLPTIDATVSGGFLDSESRQTDLVFGPDGHVTDRVIELWKKRLGIGDLKGLVTTDTRVMWGDSMTFGRMNNALPISQFLSERLGKPVVNKGISSENTAQIQARMLPDQVHRDSIVYLWAGRNDVEKSTSTPEGVVMGIRRMAEHLTPVRRKLLVLEVIPWVHEVFGSTARTRLDSYNTAIKAAFPDYWVPLASWMLTDAAAESVGHTWTEADNAARAQGTTPPSFLSDGGHYNTLGNQAAAYRLFLEEQNRGWI